MSSRFATALVLLIFCQTLSVCFCEVTVNLTDSQPHQGDKDNFKEQHKENVGKRYRQHMPTKETHTKFRNKRDSSATDNEWSIGKRPREFVGKRSYELNPMTPEFFDEFDASLRYPVEVGDRSLYFDTDSIYKSDKDFDVQSLSPREDKRLRDFVGKRSNDNEDGLWVSYDKRQRDFIGKRGYSDFLLEKRPREFVGKRVRDFVGKRGFGLYGEGIQKRPREFVGKRSGREESEDLEIAETLREIQDSIDHTDNRPRGFLGKDGVMKEYDDVDKRLRDFVGKRGLNFIEIPDTSIDKRPREFVGKREAEDDFTENKRIREFVGKRESPFNEVKRIREFIGKRNEKRPREFVGKQSSYFGDVPNRIDLDKKLRDFVGKRSSNEEVKRVRDFVGKRSVSSNESDDMLLAVKRQRDFVGEGTYPTYEPLNVIVKRIREFVGRR